MALHHQCFIPRFNKPLNSLFATFADLHVRKRATFADLHSYTHAYCSFILLNEAITIVFGLHCLHALLICLFGIFHNLQVKRYSELNILLLYVAPIPMCPKIMWHMGDLYVANKGVNWLQCHVEGPQGSLPTLVS